MLTDFYSINGTRGCGQPNNIRKRVLKSVRIYMRTFYCGHFIEPYIHQLFLCQNCINFAGIIVAVIYGLYRVALLTGADQ